MNNICEKCGSIDTDKEIKEGMHKTSQFIILMIFFFMIVFISPIIAIISLLIGIVYLATAKSLRFYIACTSCNGENTFIKIDTPKGKQLFKQYSEQ